MRKCHQTILILSLICIGSAAISAQQVMPEEKEVSRQGMWYVIPEVNLWFGNYSVAELSPQIAYHISDRWSLGTGFNYNFYKEIETYYTTGYATHLYGARAFSRYALLRNAEQWLPIYLFSDLFVQLEFQVMNMESKHFYAPSYPDNGRFWSEQVYIGAGFTQNISPYSSYSFLLLWDMNRNIYSPYGNPVYRIGLNIYLGARERQ